MYVRVSKSRREKNEESSPIYTFCANLSLIKEEKTERKENALSFSIFHTVISRRRLSVLLRESGKKEKRLYFATKNLN